MSDTRIFVLDDEVGVTRLCDRFLTRAGFAVTTANHPQDGLARLASQQYDLLLVDIRMPDLDGFQVVTEVRGTQPELAVVIMTGYGTVETAVESLHQGADGMLLKPFSGAELVQSVKRALRDKQREREMLRLQALQPLLDISEILFAEKSVAPLQTRLLEIVCERFNCAHASFYQYDPNHGDWERLACLGEDLEPSDRWTAAWQDLETPVLYTYDNNDNPVRQTRAGDPGYVMVIPIRTRDAFFILAAARGRSERAFDPSEFDSFFILSRQATAALENAALYAELEKRLQQLETSQNALVQAEKMAAVGRLTASIAHEINNPLHSIRNCLHLVDRQELPKADREEYLEMASEEMDRLMNTVRQMLDFYRPSAVERKKTDINQLIQRTLKLLELQLEDASVNVELKLDRDIKNVSIVENQIQQVLFNLILNAIEAMPEGGTINIQTQQMGQVVSILVDDTGGGIAPKQADEIFEPFVSTKEGGLGLGLTVSYGIITAHGGQLELLPQDGNGARFRLSLPYS